MITELQVAARRLLKSPWSAGAAVLIAAIGSGLNTAVFAVTYGVLLRPLPYHDSPRLALVEVGVPLASVPEWRDQLSNFERVGAYTAAGSIVRGLDEPRFAPVATVDEEFFATLGTAALAGRTFGRGEDAVAVLSERVAEQTGIPVSALLGRNIMVGAVPATVIGIMPATFAFPSQATAVWVPARSSAALAFDRSRDERRFRLVGRLQPGVTLAQANDVVSAARRQLVPGFNEGSSNRPPVSLLKETIVGPIRPVLAVFVVFAVFALLIASANVATLLLGLALARRREFKVRAALGASRWQLAATIFAESILIAAAGTLLGVAFAAAAVSVIGSWGAGILPRLGDVRVDWLVFTFAAAITSVASVMGAAPAIHAIAKETVTAREAIGGTRAAVRVRRVLLAVQIGLAALLMSIGALLTHSVYGLLSGELGVESRGVLVSQLMVTDSMSFEALGRR
ncbi:MAG: ABC transporter permease, partial [Acidobacteria bacterium]|nr:ABC transporter permease [Acidobacteriota bacterium]